MRRCPGHPCLRWRHPSRQRERVDLIRMDGQGRTTVKQLRYDPNAVLSSPNNPPMRNGDVVVVDRNNLTKFTDGMDDALQPLTPIVNAASMFRILGLPTGVGHLRIGAAG